ncbi:MAG: GNAT family N-acetyltransferase [candidate division Zixibacteria bacterium]|nr:GNAT family N-acetyltransferase [candidate division Zixibacteria bacterium]
MKKSKLIVRAATEADYPAIALLLNNTFGPVSYEKRLKLWRWRYNDNPDKTNDIPPFLVGDQDGMIMAVQGFIPLRMKIRDQIFISGCSCDLAVNPKARSAGMKIKLRALKKELTQIPTTTTANVAANKITLSLGGKELSPARNKFIKPIRYSGLIKKKISAKAGSFLGGIAGILVRPVDWVISLKSDSKRLPANQRIASISLFDTRFDQFWNSTSNDYENLFVRDSAYLNWRYIKYPFSGISAFGLFEGDSLKGYYVIHRSIDNDGLPFLAILELMTRKDDIESANSLLSDILKQASKEGIDTVIAKAISVDMRSLYTETGFRIRPLEISPFTYKNNTDMPDEQFDTDSNWFIALGDGDACYYFD